MRPKRTPKSNIEVIYHDTNCLRNNTNQQNNDKCSTKIEVVETYKYLGVYLDDHLKWKVHAQHLQNKLRQSAYALYNLGDSAPYHVLKLA